MSKWIGFDMDETLGNLSSLSVFISVVEWLIQFRRSQLDIIQFENEFSARFVKHLITIEKEHKTQIIRPGLVDALQAMNTTNVFILSNNGSTMLLRWVVELIHALCGKQIFHPDMIFDRNHYKRIHGELKDMITVTLCIGSVPTELLFFDDMCHDLAYDPDVSYVQVPPYKYISPMLPIARAFLYTVDECYDILDVDKAKKGWAPLRNPISMVKSIVSKSFSEECAIEPHLYEQLMAETAISAPSTTDDTTAIEHIMPFILHFLR